MKFYISTTGIKRLTISSAGAGKGSPSMAATRRISVRTVLPLLLVLTLVLPFLFVRIAFIVLESATACSSTLGEADRGREGNCGFNTLASVLGSSGRKNMLKLRFRISLGGSMQGMDRSPRQQYLCDHRRENIVVIFSSDSASMCCS